MVAGLYAQNACCEDPSIAWPTNQANCTPTRAAAGAGGELRMHVSNRANCSSSHARSSGKQHMNVVQDEMQNSINVEVNGSCSISSKSRSAAGTARHWSDRVDAQSAGSFKSTLLNEAETSPSDASGRKSSTSHLQGSKSEKSTKSTSEVFPITVTMLSSSSAPTKHDDLFYRRIVGWDLNNKTPANEAFDSEVQSTVLRVHAAAVEGCTSGEDDSSGSGHSSPALSASGESKQRSNSPNSPPLNDDVVGQAADVALAVLTEESTSVLLRTLPGETAVTAAAEVETATPAVAPSLITPCASYTESRMSSSTSTSLLPVFTMADIVTALRSTPEDRHPFLDMDYQRHLREHERAQEHLNQQVVQSFQNRLSAQQQVTAFKCLLNAAHRHQYHQCMTRDVTEKNMATEQQQNGAVGFIGAWAPSCAGRWGPRERYLIDCQWRMTAEQAECDLYREGLGAVQRKLSCMCLFNPDTDVRVYDENCKMREQRCHRQHKLLVRLQRQRMRGGNPYFLEEAH